MEVKPKLSMLQKVMDLEEWSGRRRGIAREERVCKECESGEVEDVEHWLLRCAAWKTLREPLLARAQEHQEGDHGKLAAFLLSSAVEIVNFYL